jgi:hypothetical protein
MSEVKAAAGGGLVAPAAPLPADCAGRRSSGGRLQRVLIISAMKEHPVTLHLCGELRRSRLTVFFRPLLCFPHFVWFALWAFAVAVGLFPSWLVALIIGRPGNSFQRFFSAFLRYTATVIANPFPGFIAETGRYPVELELPREPEKQRRLTILLRALLAYPAIVISAIVAQAAVYPVSALAWVVALLTGRMPRGFRDFGANALRYLAQVCAYLFLLTGAYPCASPYVGISFEAPAGSDLAVEAA